MTKLVGVLTAGGDSPGLNAAIRGIGRSAEGQFGMQVIGFRDGFRGLMENRTVWLDEKTLSGILTHGGTILGTSRDKPNAMPVAGKVLDMTDLIVENYRKHHLDVLVCLGGGGTQKNAHHLVKQGLNPALSTSSRLFNELNYDTPVLQHFLSDSAHLVTAVAQRSNDLAGLNKLPSEYSLATGHVTISDFALFGEVSRRTLAHETSACRAERGAPQYIDGRCPAAPGLTTARRESPSRGEHMRSPRAHLQKNASRSIIGG